MKRVLVVLALAGSTVLVPTTAFADIGSTTMTPVFLVSGTTAGSSSVDAVPVAGPPVPAGPYAKQAKEEAKQAKEEAKQVARDDAKLAKADAKQAKADRHGAEPVSSLSTTYSAWNDPALIGNEGRTFG